MSKTVFFLSDVLNFGKHSGERLVDVLQENPAYVRWCFSTIEWFSLSTKLEEFLRDYDDETILSGRLSKELDELFINEQDEILSDDDNSDDSDWEESYDQHDFDRDDYEENDADEDYFNAITDGQYGDYNRYRENGFDMDDLADMLGF